VSQVDCFASAISEILKYSKDMQQESSTKDKTETARLSDTFILGVIGGVVLIVCFGFFLVQRSVNKNAAVLAAALERFK